VRAVEARLASLPLVELAVLKNYAGGINKVVENIKVYPLEFHVLFTSFEPWSPRDSLACQFFYNLLASTDWFAEMLRVRLLEVYERELVDQILPFKPEHFFDFARDLHTVKGHEGYDEETHARLFTLADESLIFKPPMVDRILIDP